MHKSNSLRRACSLCLVATLAPSTALLGVTTITLAFFGRGSSESNVGVTPRALQP